jgi:hypothetical protein
MARLGIGFLLVAACTSPSGTALQDVRTSDCVTCHLAAFNGTSNPVHPGFMPMTCGDCHTTHAWMPALAGGHPESKFPVADGVHNLGCTSCHNVALGSSTGGQNTDCIGCHDGNHVQGKTDPLHTDVRAYVFNAATPHFCLTCHPDGRAASHPESLFPIAVGAHVAIACNDCHDSSLGSDVGGQNANCTGCHTGTHSRANTDPHHREARNYVWSDTDKQFCRKCHPTGGRAGD